MDDVKIINSLPMTAPDLSRFRPGERVHPEAKTMPQTVPKAQNKARPAVRRLGFRLTLRGIAAFTLVFGLLLFLVYQYMLLSEITTENAKMTLELSQLKKSNAAAQKELDAQLDLRNLEQYATEVLGMIKPVEEDVLYLDLSGTDHAVVIPQPGPWDRLSDALSALAVNIKEYLT